MVTAHDPLANSLSSLSSSSAHPPSISRSYKQASQLFLTRQIVEARDVLSLLVTAPGADGVDNARTQRHAPVASASKSARCKVWSLWIAITNEILNLGVDEGGRAMDASEADDGRTGGRRWRDLAKSVGEGHIWAEIVETGYAGVEAALDAEVVANL